MTEKIVLGSGKLYVAEYSGTIPTDSALEVDENLLGYIQGGATLTYTPLFYEAKDDLGYVSKSIITNEDVILKSGVMTWNAVTLKKLCQTGTLTQVSPTQSSSGSNTLKIGGIANRDGKEYVIRFLHEDEVDGDIRVTIVGHNESGFELSFAKDKETVINAEFKAKPMDSNGTLIEYKEEVPYVAQ